MNDIDEFVFDPTKQYSNYLEFDDCKESTDDIKSILDENMCMVIPETYRSNVVFSYIPSTPGLPATMAWKYTPKDVK